MNPIEQALSLINPPTSPLQDDMKTKIMQMVINQIKGIPQDVVKSTQSAVNISPPGDLARRLTTQRNFNKYGGVPFEEQRKFTTDNIKDAIQASHLIGYAAPIRPFRPNPLNLKPGEKAVRLGSGKGWEIIDKLRNL